MVGTLVGFTIFLVLLLFAAQVVVRLYATSVVTSAATRAAETVAEAAVPEAAVPAAQAAAVEQLGSFASQHATFSWREVDGTEVVLNVAARSPEFLPGLADWSRISRTVTIRTERFR